jgi:heme-degrading monooxygenase HmoA
MSVWESVEALGAYVYGEAHRAVLRRRRERARGVQCMWVASMRSATYASGRPTISTQTARFTSR